MSQNTSNNTNFSQNLFSDMNLTTKDLSHNVTPIPMVSEGRNTVTIVIVSMALIIIMFVSIFGNLGVLFAIGKVRQLRKDGSYILIINLAITDLANGSLVMLSALIGLVMDSWQLGQVICDITCALNYCLMITSMLTLFFISCDRYQAIVHPLKYHSRMTKKTITAMILYAWFQGIAFSVTPVIFGWIEYDYWEAICAINWYKEQEQALYYVIAAFILCYLIPGVLMAICYIRISFIANKAKYLQNNKISETRSAVSRKVIRSLIIVVVAYFICLSPFSITKLMKVISRDSVPGPVSTAASLIAYCSSAVNPWIYGIFRRDFRCAYKALLIQLCGRSKKTVQSSHNKTSSEIVSGSF